MTNQNTIDLNLVQESFSRCLKNGEDIYIKEYNEGYTELIKFLHLIGSVFSFVCSDVESKLKIMMKHLEGDNASQYQTFRSMMQYEKDNNLHTKTDFVSGSRTMLRLHRGLDFIRLFFKRLSEADNSVTTSSVCQSSYNETLAQYHPWYIRKAALLAMLVLPARADLLTKVFGSEASVRAAVQVLPNMLSSCDEAYATVDKLYTEFEFHNLP